MLENFRKSSFPYQNFPLFALKDSTGFIYSFFRVSGIKIVILSRINLIIWYTVYTIAIFVI